MAKQMIVVCAWSETKEKRIGQLWQELAINFPLLAEVPISHGICPDCAAEIYPDHYSP